MKSLPKSPFPGRNRQSSRDCLSNTWALPPTLRTLAFRHRRRPRLFWAESPACFGRSSQSGLVTTLLSLDRCLPVKKASVAPRVAPQMSILHAFELLKVISKWQRVENPSLSRKTTGAFMGKLGVQQGTRVGNCQPQGTPSGEKEVRMELPIGLGGSVYPGRGDKNRPSIQPTLRTRSVKFSNKFPTELTQRPIFNSTRRNSSCLYQLPKL